MAYEVLGDEKKRKVYDRYGLMGLQMYSSYASAGVMGDILFNPVLLCVALMFITLLITIAILFPAFLAVKIDGLVTWSWAAVFAPLWVLDIIALLYFVRDICSKEEPEHREGDEDDLNEAPPKSNYIRGTFNLLKFILFILWQIFIVIRAPGPESGWTWVKVWSPVYILEIFAFFEIAAELYATFSLHVMANQPLPTGMKIITTIHSYRWWVTRSLQWAFIVIRADNIVSWHWAVVAIPFFAGVGVSLIIDYAYMFRVKSLAPTPEVRSEVSSSIWIKTIMNVFCLSLIITFIALLVVYLNDGERTMGVVLVPIFIILGFLCLCCCCCTPCLYYTLKAGNPEGDLESGLLRMQVQLTLPLLEPGPGNTRKWTIDDA